MKIELPLKTDASKKPIQNFKKCKENMNLSLEIQKAFYPRNYSNSKEKKRNTEVQLKNTTLWYKKGKWNNNNNEID